MLAHGTDTGDRGVFFDGVNRVADLRNQCRRVRIDANHQLTVHGRCEEDFRNRLDLESLSVHVGHDADDFMNTTTVTNPISHRTLTGKVMTCERVVNNGGLYGTGVVRRKQPALSKSHAGGLKES